MKFKDYLGDEFDSMAFAVTLLLLVSLFLTYLDDSIVPLLFFSFLLIVVFLSVIICLLKNIQNRLEVLIKQKENNVKK